MTSKYVKILRETTPTEPTGAEFFYQQMEKNAEAIEGYEAILKSAVATGGGGSPSSPQTQSDGTLPTNENEMGAGPQPNEAPVINNITAWSGRNPDGPQEVKDTKCEDTAADRVLSKAAGLPPGVTPGQFARAVGILTARDAAGGALMGGSLGAIAGAHGAPEGEGLRGAGAGALRGAAIGAVGYPLVNRLIPNAARAISRDVGDIMEIPSIMGKYVIGPAATWGAASKAGAKVKPKETEKTAGDMPPFLEQNRPDKVKEIYSALKRDHPDMPAEVKARIASRKGKKSPQARKSPKDGGPKYKAPLNFKRKGDSYVKKKTAEEEKQAKTFELSRMLTGAAIGGGIGAVGGGIYAGTGGNPDTRAGRIVTGVGTGAASGALIGAVNPIAGAAAGSFLGGVGGRSSGYVNQRHIDRWRGKEPGTKTAEQYARITTPEGPAVVPMSQIEPLLEQIQQNATRGAIAGAGAGGAGGAIGGGLLGGFGARSLSKVLGAKPGLAQAIPTAAGALLGAAGGGGVGTPAGAYVGHERAIGKGQEQLMELARQYMPPGAEKTGGVMDVLRNPAVQHTLFGAGAGAVGSGIGSAIGSQTPEGHAADIASHMVRGAVAGGAAGYGGHLMGLEGKATYVLPALLGSALGVQAFGEQAMPGRAGVFGVDRDDPRAEALASEVREMEAKTAAIPAIMKDPRVIGTAIGAAGGGGVGYLSGDPSVPGDRARATAIGTVLGGGMGALGGIMSRNSGAAGAMAKLQHEAQVREAVSKAELLKRDNTIDIGTRALKEIQEDDARRAQWSLGGRMSQRGTG